MPSASSCGDVPVAELGRAALTFLEQHRLDPTPSNYLFAYTVVTAGDVRIVEEARAHDMDGIRMAQAAVTELLEDRLGTCPGDRPEMGTEEIQQLASTIQTIARDTRAQVGETGRDLAAGGEELARHTDQATLTVLVGQMVDRAAQAERDLRTSVDRIEKLERDLEEASSKAHIDELTGLPNRRSAKKRMRALVSSPGAQLALIDIDNFKQFNDIWGHDCGDAVLRHVARYLSDMMAPAMVARWGGEEFLIVADTLRPAIFLERLENAKRSLSLSDAPSGLPDAAATLTFSAGVTAMDDTPEAALKRADKLLYAAKRSGRNRILR